ncbi:glycosyltransferase [Halobacillus halophilus]|uniref:glycosyltransferase family 4 protein n=1 Tax=Halobacillus halophilus TaxID=1570 RepID=UPI00136B3BD3|nr:glycosyltransferase family 4 protein [Halobacillus halophilus]MYL30780.1 glycosyltransferase [Halobacillus halophilus]
MKKVCFLKSDFNGGGTERVTSVIANGLAKFEEDFEIYVLDINNPNKTKIFNLDDNIRHHSITNIKKGKLSIIYSNYKLYNFLKKYKIDILVNVQAMMGVHSLLPTLVTKTKNIIWEHANFYQKQGTKVIDMVRQLELLFSSHYVVLTEKDKKNFENNFICKCPVDNIYNPIYLKNATSYKTNSTTIISVGHLRQIKGFDMIIDVAGIVFKYHPEWVWKIYGEGPERVKLEREIKALGLEKNIVLCGRTNNIENAYKEAAMYVLTSRSEGLPMVLLEAKAYNLPIVSFDIETGPDEIIDQSVNGYLVEKNNVEDMATRICHLIENEKTRKAFSNNAKNNIEKFDEKEILNKWINLFNKF